MQEPIMKARARYRYCATKGLSMKPLNIKLIKPKFIMDGQACQEVT
jgi:hypothetical protein